MDLIDTDFSEFPDPVWRSEAACIGAPTDLFFPENSMTVSKIAKAICDSCPVKEQCLEFALVTFENHGYWGGTTPKQRRILRAEYFKNLKSTNQQGE